MAFSKLLAFGFICIGPKTVFFWAPIMKWVSQHWCVSHSATRGAEYNAMKCNNFFPLWLNAVYTHAGKHRRASFKGLVCAGMADMARPAEKLSTSQSAVLMATGLIWSRYSLVIIPKNWGLFTVNFFVGCAGGSQLYRIWRYNQELKAKEQS